MPAALSDAAGRLGEELDFHRFLQFEFDQQWQRLRRYCGERSVRLAPPLVIRPDQVDTAVALLEDAVAAVAAG